MSAGNELHTWKEIANYFGRSVRTVQIWETKLGLPVRRLGESGQIFALVSELAAWKETQLVGKPPAPNPEIEEFPVVPGDAPVAAPPEAPERSSRIRKSLFVIAAFAAAALAWGAFRFIPRRLPTPDHFIVDGRLLTVFDERNDRLWTYVFPELVSNLPIQNTDDSILQRYKMFDARHDGHGGLLFSTVDRLYSFRNDGSVAWTYRPGRSVETRQGSTLPAEYTVQLVGALSKPRPDGGQIIIGAHRGPSALFVVELLTADGRKVDEYFHFGWFLFLQTGVFDKSGVEDIFLGGVDNVSGNSSDYGATLVVLDPTRFSGQASTLVNDPRALKNVKAAEEKALLLFREFTPNQDAARFCYGQRVVISPDALELYVTQGPGYPSAHFIFDKHLKLQSVLPNAYLQQILAPTILKGKPSGEWPDILKEKIGDIQYVRNGF